MKRNEVLRPIPGQAWHHVPTFDDLVEGIYEAPPFKPKAYEYLRILNSPAIQQLVGNANLAASAAQREAYMGQREAVLQAVAHEAGMDARTIKEVHERRIASGEIDGAGWYPPSFSKPRSEPVGEHDSPPLDTPPPPPKPRQPPGGGASARSPSRPIFEFGGSSGSGPGNGPFLGVGRRKSPLPVPEGVPAELGPRGPPPGPGPSGASQAAAVAAHNKIGEKGRETKEALDRVHELMREYHEKQTKIATAW